MSRTKMSACVFGLMVIVMTHYAIGQDKPANQEGHALTYWERRLPGARMSWSLRALVSPLTPIESLNYAADFGRGASAHRSQEYIASFCRNANVICSLDDAHTAASTIPEAEADERDGKGVQGEAADEGVLPLLYYTKAADRQQHGIGSDEGGKDAKGSKDLRLALLTSSSASLKRFFREKQVLASGIHFHEDNYAADKDSRQDFLPRELSKFFSLQGDGLKMIQLLGLSKRHLLGATTACLPEDIGGQLKACVYSIEDMADFVGSVMESDKRNTSVVMYDSVTNGHLVQRHESGDSFRVLHVKSLTNTDSDPYVACHSLPFPLRLVGCHYTNQSKVFEVTLEGEDGHAHKRIALCHYNTSAWNPLHWAFQDLQTKPGESEVCHWLEGRSLQPIGWVFVRGGAPSTMDMHASA